MATVSTNVKGLAPLIEVEFDGLHQKSLESMTGHVLSFFSSNNFDIAKAAWGQVLYQELSKLHRSHCTEELLVFTKKQVIFLRAKEVQMYLSFWISWFDRVQDNSFKLYHLELVALGILGYLEQKETNEVFVIEVPSFPDLSEEIKRDISNFRFSADEERIVRQVYSRFFDVKLSSEGFSEVSPFIKILDQNQDLGLAKKTRGKFSLWFDLGAIESEEIRSKAFHQMKNSFLECFQNNK